MTNNLFVYGTLRSGHSRNDILENSKLIGIGVTNGLLYDLGVFPAAKFSGKKSLLGEVYEISSETLNVLDMIEGNGHLFNRIKIQVLVNGEYRECWGYEFMHDVDNRTIVQTGDYLNPDKSDYS